MSTKEEQRIESLQKQIDSMRNRINHLTNDIIQLHTRITNEIKVAKITFRDIDTLKEAHQSDKEHFRHEHTKGDLSHVASVEEQPQEC